MKRTVPRPEGPARDVAKGELIGRTASVVSCHDASMQGRKGTIVDETLHTLSLREGGPGGRRILVSKVGTVFGFQEGDKTIEVDGAALEFRSWDRTKKVR